MNLGFGFGSVFTENRGFGFGFKTDPALGYRYGQTKREQADFYITFDRWRIVPSIYCEYFIHL